MGIFSVSRSTDAKKLEALLVEGERIESIYKLRVDQICFTNKRIIFFDNKMFSKRRFVYFFHIKQLKALPFKKRECLIRTLGFY